MDEQVNLDITGGGEATVIAFKSTSLSEPEMVAAVSRQINAFVEQSRPGRIIFDFGMVKFFSSQVLGLLLDIRAKLKEYEGEVLISGINPQLYRVFKITNLDKLFRFFPDKEAAIKAISSPLLENISICGAKGVLVNVTGGEDLTLFEVNEAANIVLQEAGDEANIIFGAVLDKNLKDEIKVTVIATGLEPKQRFPESFEGNGDAFTAEKIIAQKLNAKKQPAIQEDVFQRITAGSHNGEDYEVPAFMRRKPG